jgi:porin
MKQLKAQGGEPVWPVPAAERHRHAAPPGAAALYPVPFDEETTLTSVVFTQFLTEWFGLYLGKIDTFSGDANAFAHEWKAQFMNTGFGPNPVTVTTVPYATLGAGVLLRPTDAVLLNVSALSPDGTADSAGFDELYEHGVVLAGELRVGIKPFGLPGHPLIGGTWSSKTFITLQQDPRLLLVFLGLPLDVPIRRQSGSWSAYYNFDQFLYTTTADGSEGIGIFGRIGVADPDTNPPSCSIAWASAARACSQAGPATASASVSPPAASAVICAVSSSTAARGRWNSFTTSR